jgi:hypothetical protein
MTRKLIVVCAFVTLAGFACLSSAQSQLELVSPDSTLRLRPHGYGHFEAGQVVTGNGTSAVTARVSNLWTENAFGQLAFEVAYKNHLKINFGLETKLYFSFPQQINQFVTKYDRQDVFLGPTYAELTYGTPQKWGLNLFAGYFSFKYNSDVRNLGEYMFRSATYPAYIITGFDYPQADLLGARLNSELFNKSLKQDLLLTSETVYYPTMDFSLSYLLSYNVLNKNFLEIGAGGMLAHLISVYDDKYPGGVGGSLTDPRVFTTGGNRYIVRNIGANGDTVSDTAYYSFRGNKVMGRLSLDPKAFFPGSEKYFGEDDLKAYLEVIVIGTKSYPDSSPSGIKVSSYENILQKMPVSFGFNLPSFKVLDVLNMEFEWWDCRYYNDYGNIYRSTSLPMPSLAIPQIVISPWKWSVYAKKSFFDGHLSFIAQAARDHMRLPCAQYDLANGREMLVEAGTWWWCFKTAFSF